MSGTKTPSNRQIIILFFGFLVLFILVFALGVIVGKGLGDPEVKIAENQPIQQPDISKPASVPEKQASNETGEISQKELEDILNKAKTGETEAPGKTAQTDTIEIETSENEKRIAMNAESEVNLKVEKPDITTKEPQSLLSKDTPLPPIVPDGQYTIQIGSFKNEADAKSLQNKLKSKGYPAFLKQVTIGQDTWFRLRIGTFENKDQAKLYGDILLKKEPELVKSVYTTLNV